ncbi:hypothetical protein OKW38_004863 [Paraburkholderia sp. MM5496-R1]|uniref:hypothetical protein n=1 Tax=Paraburkholderia TaxID=1822464 RepID=UPI001FC8AD86|nr:hypothetical protein [Paraburkholderia tuberum]
MTVLRATPSHIYFESKISGSTQAPREVIAGADWSRERSVNGTDTVVNRPFAFPLSPGKSGTVEYAGQHPNRVFASQKWNSQYRVVGTETVEVPAGKFQAIKIEAEGDWDAQLEPRQTVTQASQVEQGDTAMITHAQKLGPVQATGRTYKAFWYVPEVGRWVKSVEEYYGSNGVRNERYTTELESFKKSGQ